VTELAPWWERFSGRLEWEVSRLEAAGVAVRLDEQRRDGDGVIELTMDVPSALTGVEDLTLVATFPPAYPFLAPSVAAPSLQLRWHQHPFGNTLCLVGRGTHNWAPDDDLAFLITNQLRDAIALGAGNPYTGTDREEPQGEPFTDYYTYQENAVVLVDSSWSLPTDAQCGDVALLWGSGTLDIASSSHTTFIAQDITTAPAGSVATMPERVVELWPQARPWSTRWSLLSQPLREDDPDALWQSAEQADRRRSAPSYTVGNLEVQLRLVGFPEEHAKDVEGLGWVLLLRTRPELPKGHRPPRPKGGNPAKARPWTTVMVRSGRIGREDLAARVPTRLADLAGKHVMVVGAGALGSVIVEHLARAGVGAIDVVDRDVLEPGNATRHACNVMDSGMSKAMAVGSLARRINPYAQVNMSRLPLGQVSLDGEAQATFVQAMTSVDVVVDATAEVGVQAYTADLARTFDKAWVSAEAVNGAWGGTVVTIPAGASWCRDCLQWHYADGAVDLPEADPAPLTQPIGCAEPTFSGTSADLAEVSAHAARTVLAVLTGDAVDGADVVKLRQDGQPILPRWTHFAATRHPKCQH